MDDDKNEIINIGDMFGKFKSVAELRAYSKQIFLKLQQALTKLKEQESEILQLKSMLLNNSQFDIIPPEQLTCEMEIRRLESAARSRPLSMEEAKIFDIMTKNLLAIKKAMLEQKKPPKEIEADEAVLLSIVKNEQNK